MCKNHYLYSLMIAKSHFLSKIWSRWSDLNRRPIDYESIALPTELHRPITSANKG